MLKALVQDLGVALFRRVNRGIFLTDAGQSYLPPVRNAFRLIAEASGRIAVAAESGILTVSVTPLFAAAWLVPRLKAFQDAHPDVDLRVLTDKGWSTSRATARTSRFGMVSDAIQACAASACSR